MRVGSMRSIGPKRSRCTGMMPTTGRPGRGTSGCSRPAKIEFTFCSPSSAAIDPVDPGTAAVVSNGWRVLLDKAGRFENLALAIPR